MQSRLTIVVLSALVGVAVGKGCTSRVPHDPGEMFELVGLHAQVSCETCHTDGTFGPLDPTCGACHEDERPGLDHYAGQDCGDAGCHTPYGWLVFTTPTGGGTAHPCIADHDECLPLINGHDLECASCHVDPAAGYAGLDSACSSCHEEDRPPYHYEGQDCEACHTITVWEDGVEHPILLPHFDAACESCHVEPADRTQYTCYGGACHAQPETDALHDNVYGYTYASPECVACHPDGTN